MPIRSMTGFAQIKGQQGKTAYTFSAKSVNHRFLDLHLRLPGGPSSLSNSFASFSKRRCTADTWN